MSQINRPPLGLQSLLGSQNFGTNPPELAQEVQPTVDLFPFFAAQTLKTEASVGGRATEGIVTSVVLSNRCQIVACSAHMYNGLTSNETIQAGFALRGLFGDTPQEPMFLYVAEPRAFAIGAQCAWSWYSPSPLIIEPGTTLDFVYTYAGLTAAESVRLNVLYYDLGS